MFQKFGFLTSIFLNFNLYIYKTATFSFLQDDFASENFISYSVNMQYQFFEIFMLNISLHISRHYHRQPFEKFKTFYECWQLREAFLEKYKTRKH